VKSVPAAAKVPAAATAAAAAAAAVVVNIRDNFSHPDISHFANRTLRTSTFRAEAKWLRPFFASRCPPTPCKRAKPVAGH
jgi:hypothetical protein